MIAWMLQVWIGVACIGISCNAFAPGSRKFRFMSPPKVSLSSDYPHGSSNHTARDVLDSLDFLANLKNLGGNNTRGVSLFEATREVDDEEEVVSPQTTSMEATNMDSQVIKENKEVAVNENSEFEAVMDEDMDALLQMSAWGGNKKEPKKANDKTTPDNVSMPGLGGSGGTSYNVNHLKKNLVQDMIERSKLELWNDLGDPTIDFSIVEDKIASLVQSNAVVCTTDSNLLDGTWTFAFGSRQCASALMDPNRFDLAARRTSKTLASKSAKVERPFRSSSRTFYLEDMQEDEDAHVLDRTSYFGGLLRKSRRLDVTRLTRNSLQLEPSSNSWFLFGTKIRQRRFQDASQQQVEDLRILYVDNDLCLSASNDLETSSFYVYTKSPQWTSQGQRMKRNARRVLSGLRRIKNSVFHIVFLRKRLQNAVIAKVSSSYGDPLAARILVNIDDDSKKMTVLKLGDLENDANAWEGEDDPFVHLSAVERQEQLKKMRVRDVRRAGQRQRNKKPKKEKGKASPKTFKKPE